MPVDVDAWRRLITHDSNAGLRALDRLARTDRTAFVALCHELLRDPSIAARKAGLRMLSLFGIEGDAEAEATAQASLAEPELREWAALALGRVGSPASFQVLADYARGGSPSALRVMAKMAKTPEQQHLVLEIARQFVLDERFPVRNSAVRIVLPTLSNQEKENLLIEIVRRYFDEEALGSLRHATERVVPMLRGLLEKTVPGTAEQKDILQTIHEIESRASPFEANNS